MRAVLSPLAVAMRAPSGEKLALLTQLSCRKMRISAPVCESHRRAERSSLVVRICWLLGEKTAVSTPAVWPVSLSS